MPITVEWANAERTVLLYRVTEHWTWDDFHSANQTTHDLLVSIDHPVDLICDFSTSQTIPPRVLSNIGRALRQKRPGNVRQIVVVGVTGLLRNLADVLRTLYPNATANIIDAHTIEHAFRLLSATGKTQ
ncbi:MAG: hypothetical protein ABI690_07430 [Chloroflexota bacterium]